MMMPEAPTNTPGMVREALRELIREELERFLIRADGTPYREPPIEPLFTVEVACWAIPCSKDSLQRWLKQGGFEPMYRWYRGHQRYRLIPASQIRWVREQMTRPKRRIGRGDPSES